MNRLFFIIAVLSSFSIYAEDISICKQGHSESLKKNYELAHSLFSECIEKGELSPKTLSRTYRNMGINSKNNGKYDEAIEFYNKALSLNPDDPWDDYVNRGNAWSEKGDFEKSFKDYDKALSLKPNYNEVYYNRGIVFEKKEDFERAKSEFKKAYEYGLRTRLLYERFLAHGLTEKK
jgi:tetratricopeptide (TPR) repeat protein